MVSPAPVHDEVGTALPRIALFISDNTMLQELETILRSRYSSLLVVTRREKLAEFRDSLVIVTDTIREVALLKDSHPVEGTQILVISHEQDSESTSAAFEAGASDYLAYPFVDSEVLAKTERYLEPFRKSA